MHKWLIIQVAGLGADFVRRWRGERPLAGFTVQRLVPAFPALTCPAQAAFRTAAPLAAHGMPGNGIYLRELHKTLFWEQAAALVRGARIWDEFRRRGGRVGLCFWQQSMGESVDLLLTPAPIHKHGGGLVDAVYAQPVDLYERLRGRVGRRFHLRQYWGPLASVRGSGWIAEATAALLREPDAPELCLTYLPGLDYDLQRFGPEDARAGRALDAVEGQIALLHRAAREDGYTTLIFGDYAIAPVRRAVFPNRALRQAGMLRVREVQRRLYADLPASRAFAVADHQVAHVYVSDPGTLAAAASALRATPGIAEVWDRAAASARGVNHAAGGDLIAVAAPDAWLAYPWWERDAEAPDYARHVDIHNKPGYDPLELFFGWPPGGVSLDAARIRGSHGRVGGAETETAWASDGELKLGGGRTLLDLAEAMRRGLEE